jgi:hypothetical protein
VNAIKSRGFAIEKESAMIFPYYKTIFFHVGKTAGTAVEKMLMPIPLDPYKPDRRLLFGKDAQENIRLQHATCKTVKRLAGEEIFNTYFKFTLVRNPYTRMVSVFYYLYNVHKKQFGSFKNFIMLMPLWAKDQSLLKGSHYIPQIHYTHIDGEKVVDYVAKFEELPASLDPVRSRLGITRQLERHADFIHPRRPSCPMSEIYGREMVAVMQEVFARDFQCFGYNPEPPNC